MGTNERKLDHWLCVVVGVSCSLAFWGSIAYFGMRYQEREEREHPKTCQTEIVMEIVSAHYRGVKVRTDKGTIIHIDQPTNEIRSGHALYVCRRNNTEPMLEYPPK